MPDTKRSQRVAMNISVRLNAPTVSYDASLLIWFVRFVISVERNSQSLLALANLAYKNRSRVTNVCAEDLSADNKNGYACGSTEAKIDF